MHSNVQLQLLGLKGEYVVDDTVWIVKTHFPWVMAEQPEFSTSKIICVVRNPLQSVYSWLEFLSTQKHDGKFKFNISEDYPKMWDWWVHDLIPKIR